MKFGNDKSDRDKSWGVGGGFRVPPQCCIPQQFMRKEALRPSFLSFPDWKKWGSCTFLLLPEVDALPTLNSVEGISAVTQALDALESHRHVWASFIGLVSSGRPFLIKLRSIRKDSVGLHQAVLFLQSRGGRQSIPKPAPGAKKQAESQGSLPLGLTPGLTSLWWGWGGAVGPGGRAVRGSPFPQTFSVCPLYSKIRNLSMEEVGEPWRKGNEDPVSIQELETKKNQAAHTYWPRINGIFLCQLPIKAENVLNPRKFPTSRRTSGWGLSHEEIRDDIYFTFICLYI